MALFLLVAGVVLWLVGLLCLVNVRTKVGVAVSWLAVFIASVTVALSAERLGWLDWLLG